MKCTFKNQASRKADFRAERVEEKTKHGDVGGAFGGVPKVQPELE